MTPERWQQIEHLFNSALKLPTSERQSFLDDACGDDHSLRSEVESLLASDETAHKLSEAIGPQVAAQMFADRQSTGLVGRTIGRYRVISSIGAGGMGEVYLAEDTTLGRKVAIKVLPHFYTSDPERVHRFEQEARAASALNHPHIVTIHEIGDWHGTQFIVTEFIDGQTLRQRLQSGPVGVDELIEIGLQSASALATAHNAGIVHRDIKPANIMLRSDGYVKILDFGLAKLTANSSENTLEAKTDPGRVMGTIHYMSPEQALGQQVDQRTDIFSLGVVLYELASGQLPFVGNSDAAVYNEILNKTPATLEHAPASLPTELTRIIERALEKTRERRYQSASELHADLKRLQNDSNLRQATAITPKPESHRIATVAIVVLLAIAIGATYYFFARRRQEAELSRVAALPPVSANFAFNQHTGQPGIEYFPTLSPDGQTLVYASQESGNWDLWKQESGNNERVNLTKESPADDLQPSFSPDGKQLAFRSERDGGGLFVMNLEDQTVRKITRVGFNPSWSPDGTELAYSTVSVTFVESRGLSELWVVRLSNGQQRFVKGQDAVQPAWSPNGQRIAYWSERGILWTVPSRGGAPIRITPDKGINWNPCWSPDGKYLYFTSDRRGSMNLWRVAIDENTGQVLGAFEPATTPSTDMLHLAISRNGRNIAYVQRTKQRRLQSISFDPVKATVQGEPAFITHGTSFATHPEVSPDGNRIVYTSSGSPREDIFVANKDGSGVKQLTNDVFKDRLPSWTPDGKQIVFFSDRDNRNEIWSVASDGSGSISQVTFSGGRAISPTISPDGTRMAYYEVGVGTFIIDLTRPWQDQTPQPITHEGRLDPALQAWKWSSDGKRLGCVVLPTGSRQIAIAVYSFATDNAPSKLELLVENADYPALVNNGRHVVYAAENRLFVVDIETKQSRELVVPEPNQTPEYPVLSPDNRMLYYSLATTEADIWMATIQ